MELTMQAQNFTKELIPVARKIGVPVISMILVAIGEVHGPVTGMGCKESG